MIKFLLRTVSITIFIFSMGDTIAQPGGGDPNGGNPPGAVPIGGLELLLIAGGALGAGSLIKSNRKKDY